MPEPPDPLPAVEARRRLRAAGAALSRRLGWVVGLGWAAVALLWLLDAAGRGLPTALDRLAAAATLAATAALALRGLRRLWCGEGPYAPTACRMLLALLALSFAVHFIGLGHELTGRYFGDEGIYLARARRVNDGQLLFSWFIYPHLLIYLDALALWLAGLFQPAVDLVGAILFGAREPQGPAALVTRWVTAGCGALTVLPIFAVARRIAGPLAAALAGLFAVLSPLYIEVAHLNISDVLGAFLATLVLVPVAALLDEERNRHYLLAGLLAGLAAGSKYPAGVAAVAVAPPFLRWRLRRRGWGAGLLWAALAAVAVFLATTPSLLAFPKAVFGGGADVLFGLRQYAQSGWTGVIRSSNTLYYLDQLRFTFGGPLLVLGMVGLTGLDRRTWGRLAWMLPFPVAYLLLMISMSMAVPRNLQAALPMLAVLLGVGVSGHLRWLDRLPARARRAAVALLLLVCLYLPARRTVVLLTQLARANTREVAAAWIYDNLPVGSFFIQEDYTPRLQPPHLYPSAKPRFVNRFTREQLRDPLFDFIFVASDAYGRFLDPDNLEDPYQDLNARSYQEIFETFEPVKDFEPGSLRRGPILRIFKVDPDPLPTTTAVSFRAADALPSNPHSMPVEGGAGEGDTAEEANALGEGAIAYQALAQWSLFKAYLEPGSYRLSLRAEVADPGGGRVRVMNRDNELVDARPLEGEGSATVSLPRRDKYFFYIHLPAGSLLRGMTVARERAPSGPADQGGAGAG